MPEEIPPAIRSRCLEVFFRSLTADEILVIAKNAAKKINMEIEEEAVGVIARYATNGREAVNIVQIAAGLVTTSGGSKMRAEDIEWVVNSGQYAPRPDKKIPLKPQVGVVNGLAVGGPNIGMLVELEASVIPSAKGKGQVIVTGVVDEEEMGGSGRRIRRKSMARSSVENVLTVLRRCIKIDPRDYDLHINFPGGVPIDGPSAGVTIATAVYSAITGKPVDNKIAMTGEVSIQGYVKPVGGIVAKVEAARVAGAKSVYIPKENWQEMFKELPGIEVIPVEKLEEIIEKALISSEPGPAFDFRSPQVDILAASASLPSRSMSNN
jgi:Lon-like ATP-dependent protease